MLKDIKGDIASEFGAEIDALPHLEPEVVKALRVGFKPGQLSARSLARLVRRAMEGAVALEEAFTVH